MVSIKTEVMKQKDIDDLTDTINSARILMDRLKQENDKLKEMKSENKFYYLMHLNKKTDYQNNTQVFEAIYSNGLKEISKVWKYGDTILTIIHEND
jgi:hypothetical protein